MTDLLFDAILCALLVGLAWQALTSRTLFRAIVLFIGFGLSSALAWVRLAAPDMALAEAAIGAGLTGALLLDAAARFGRGTGSRGPGRSVPRSVALRAPAAAAALVIGAIVLLAARSLPDAPSSLAGEVAAAVERSGVRHPVTAVLLAFRAWDTFLELAVLLLAVLGAGLIAGAVTPERAAFERSVEMPLLWLIRLVAPGLVLLAGAVLLQGATGPGGAFQAGALLAAGAVLLELAGHPTVARLPPLALSMLWLAGVGAFVVASVVGLARGRLLLELPADAAAGWIHFLEIAASVSIGAGLVSLFLAARTAGEGS
jgi:multisubunit Na+/H+ antiporter MnhB subunit